MSADHDLLVICDRLRRHTTNMDVVTVVDALLARLHPGTVIVLPSSSRDVSADKPVPTSADGCAVCAARKAKDAQRKSKQRGKS